MKKANDMRVFAGPILRSGKALYVVTAILLSASCAPLSTDDLSEPTQSSTNLTDGSAPALVASLQLEGGNTIEFYELERSAAISETGVAYSPPVFNRDRWTVDQLDSIWQELAPDEPVPEALLQLQERLLNVTEPPVAAAEEALLDVGGVEPRTRVSAPVGCDNGCCDFQWLATFTECQSSAVDYSWFLYNYGATWSNINDIIYYRGMTCSASGNSTFRVNIDGAGGVWTVAPATYRRWSWSAAFNVILCSGPCGENLRSSVNTPTTGEHLHTYCGGIWYD